MGEPSHMVVKLGPTLILSNVHEIRDSLGVALASGEPAAIDASALTELDFAGMQLLCSAHRGAARLGRSLSMVGGRNGPIIDQAIVALGFGRETGCNEGCLCKEVARG